MKKELKAWTEAPLKDKGMLRQNYKQVGLDENGKLLPLGNDVPLTLNLTDSDTNAASRYLRFDGQTRKTVLE